MPGRLRTDVQQRSRSSLLDVRKKGTSDVHRTMEIDFE